jgi:integrase
MSAALDHAVRSGRIRANPARGLGLPRFLATEIAAAVAGKHADQLVFTMPGGGVMRLPNWRRSVFLSARRRAGLSDRFRVHDLRHTAASLMIQADYQPKMLQEIMGHAKYHHDPVSPRRWTCTGICTPARWTATRTAWTRLRG